MKLRKILTAIACFMLVAVGALGFAGCAKTTKISAEEFSSFVAQTNIEEGFVNGYKISISTEKGSKLGEAWLLFSDTEPQFAMKTNAEGYLEETYYVDGYLYYKVGNEKKRVQFTIGDEVDSSGELASQLEEINDYFNTADGQYSINTFLSYFEDADLSVVGLTKTTDGNKTTLTMKQDTGMFGNFEVSFTFNGKKFTSMSMLMLGMRVTISQFSGTISFPSDLGTYTDVA